MNVKAAITIMMLSCMPALSALCAEAVPTHRTDSQDSGTSIKTLSYFVEISISRNLLTLYEIKGDAEKTPVAEYSVGSAVRGLKTYPVGLGTVTGIYFNPWWYPTPYSRQVFRERGIELPTAVPPGHKLNYMGPFKIALSHRTSKGAIYRIHGNNNPRRVGQRVTGGCFVMDNAEGLKLARMITTGTVVNIVP